MGTLSNVATRGGDANPPNISSSTDVIPEAKSSRNGVSVRYAPSPDKNWYVFRASYGREDKAYDFMVENGTFAYVAKRNVRFNVATHSGSKVINGQAIYKPESLIPNIVFAYTTAEQADAYAKDTGRFAFVNYYYNHFEKTPDGKKNTPLVVPQPEMENFILATRSRNEHLMMVSEAQCHFKSGDTVIVTEGLFKGVEGRVARVHGQQRVVITLPGLGFMTTAYIPSAFICRNLRS